MNILILGDANSPFIYEFVSRIPKENKICILSITDSSRYTKNYKERDIQEVPIQSILAKYTLTKFNLISSLIKIAKEIQDKISFGNKIDVMHVHYVEVNSMICLALIWLKAKKRILTYWGSDLFRVEPINYKLVKPFLLTSTSIVFMIQEQYDFFVKIYKKMYVKKLHIIDMGNTLLDVIDDVRFNMNKDACKKVMGFPKDKIVIHVGYNKSEAQQHVKLIESIALLSEEVIDKIFIVLPWGKECSNAEIIYRDEIERVLCSANIEYTFWPKFMSGKELAMFRISSDIFLYGQTTDAMSDSCIEYLYAGSVFLCPKWLWNNYKLINYFSTCYCYEEFPQIRELLEEMLKQNKIVIEDIDNKVREVIQNNKSWRYLMPNWLKLYG